LIVVLSDAAEADLEGIGDWIAHDARDYEAILFP